jgi:hypothetical protein
MVRARGRARRREDDSGIRSLLRRYGFSPSESPDKAPIDALAQRLEQTARMRGLGAFIDELENEPRDDVEHEPQHEHDAHDVITSSSSTSPSPIRTT